MSQKVISFENVSKEYRLGTIGSGTLRGDLQSFYARLRGKEDPNSLIDSNGKKRNKIWALKDVSFDINKGDAIGIIGKNGAGKSTLLKILSRITAPTSGQIQYVGRIASMMEVGTGFHRELTGRENIYLNGAILGMTKNDVNLKFDEIVEFSGIDKFIDTPAKRYSSGMYVKLAFSVAAHLNAEIMVMDEILAVGDVAFQQKCIDKMADIANNEGRTVLYVSHNMNTIKQLCNRAVVLEDGQLIYNGNVDEAISHYLGNAFDLNRIVDLTKIGNYSSLNGIKMSRIEIINSKDCTFSPDENLTFRLDFESDDTYTNAFLRAVIRYKDNTPAGVCQSKLIPNIKKGSNTQTFSIPLKNLIDGRYAVSLFIVNDTPAVLRPYFDHINKAFSFEVCDIKTGNWRHTAWGHTKFDDMQML